MGAKKYVAGMPASVRMRFYDAAGALFDPPTLSVTVRPPPVNGVVQADVVYPYPGANIARASVGDFTLVYPQPNPGDYFVHATYGTGNAAVPTSIADYETSVDPSPFG